MSREVPRGWTHATIGQVVDINPESVPASTAADFLLRYIDVATVEGPSMMLEPRLMAFCEAPSRARKKVTLGDILVSTVRPYLRSFCKVSSGYKNLVASTAFAVLRPRTNVDGDFLYQHILGDHFIEHLTPRMKGSNYPAVAASDVGAYAFPLPPLHEQRRIAEILSSVDEAIAATRAVIEQTRTVKQAVLERLLTKGIGHTRFKQTEIGEIPERWFFCPLSEVADIKHGYAFSGEFFSKTEGPNILLTPGNFSKEKTLYFGRNTKFYEGEIPDEFVLRNGDVLVVMTDLTPSMDILGNAVILESHKVVLHNQRIGKVKIKENILSARFLINILNSVRIQNEIKKTASGTTVRHTSPGRILANFVALPPMEEQISIVEKLQAIDDAIDSEEQKLRAQMMLKSALMADLLTGRKRVTDALPLAAE